jgi:hypothetical protein
MLSTFLTNIFSKPQSERFDPSILPKSALKGATKPIVSGLLVERVVDELMEVLYPSTPMYKSYDEMFAFIKSKDEIRRRMRDILSRHIF